MRDYPANSPEAAARIVALALLADGSIDRRECLLLERQQLFSRLGLTGEQFDAIYYDYCTDMLTCANRHESGHLELDAHNIKALLGEIREPALQKEILRIMLDIVHADHLLTAGEAALIAQALKHWGLALCAVSESFVPHHFSSAEQACASDFAVANRREGFHRVASGQIARQSGT